MWESWRWRGRDNQEGREEREDGGEGPVGRKERWEVQKEGLSVGGAFLIFLPRSLLWVCIMWRCVIGLWSHQSCANRLAGKHVSLRGCGGECVCCVNHSCGIVWEMVWWSKTYINGEQVGRLTLSQTNLFPWARAGTSRARVLMRSHTHMLNTDVFMRRRIFNASVASAKLNYVCTLLIYSRGSVWFEDIGGYQSWFLL